VSRSFRSTVTWSLIAVAVVSVIAGALLVVGLIGLGWLGGVDGIALVLDLLRSWFGDLVEAVGAPVAFAMAGVGIAGLLGLPILIAVRITTGRVVGPVSDVSQAAARVAAGSLDTRVAVHGDDEMATLQRSFNQMASALQSEVEQLARLEAGSRRFAGDVSHELRTPLAAMTAVADLLAAERPRLDPTGAEALDTVLHELAALRRLVDDVLEISRFDAGTEHLVTDLVDVPDLVDRMLARRGWTSRVEIRHLLPPRPVRLDPRRFDIVVANVVGNALQHGRPPVELTTSWTDPDLLEITVRDHGPGIPEDARSEVFERFWKADSGRARDGGSGLGLAIAREHARLHGGEVIVIDADHGGATLAIRLRCAPVEPGTDPVVGSGGSTGAL
jgi:two-component system sensor histidine kinase MtrB